MKDFFKIFSLVLFLGLSLTNAYGQREASNWYFGHNGGIHFDLASGTVVPLTDGVLRTNEGCASISDSNGNLLFYTDGITVYNKNHEIMDNGTGLFGNPSSSQSAIILKAPQSISQYYIFTVDTNDFSSGIADHGLNFWVVDMDANNGLGAVLTPSANNNLLPQCSEKLSVVTKNCNSQEFWIVSSSSFDGTTNGSMDTYHAFEVTATGINRTAIKSRFPSLQLFKGLSEGRGYMKFSPDAKKLASVSISSHVNSRVVIYDFDENTGILSNQISLSTSATDTFPYGVEFSPNSELLYVNYYNNQSAVADAHLHSSTIVQYDLIAADINASEFIFTPENTFRGALQLGPDQKIYRALSKNFNNGSNYLGIIHKPNERGLNADYEHNGIDLTKNHFSFQGLPPFDQNLFTTKLDIIDPFNNIDEFFLDLCTDEVQTLIIDDSLFPPTAIYIWYENDVIQSVDNLGNPLTSSSTRFNATKNITGQFKYNVEVQLNSGDCPISGEATLTFHQKIIVQNTEIEQCDPDGNGIVNYNLRTAEPFISTNHKDEQFNYYYTLNGAMNQDASDLIPNPENYNLDFNSTTNTSVFAHVNNLGNCPQVAEVLLTTKTEILPNSSTLTPLEACDDFRLVDGIADFNLTPLKNQIIALYPLTQQPHLDVYFYLEFEDAELDKNRLNEISHENTLSPHMQSLWIRVIDLTNNINSCLVIDKIEDILTVLLPTNIPIDFDTFLTCLDAEQNYFLSGNITTLPQGPIDTKLSPTDYSFQWYNGSVDQVINDPTSFILTGETNAFFYPTTDGIYTVIINDLNTGCQSIKEINVVSSIIPKTLIVNVLSPLFAGFNQVEIIYTGDGEFEFKIDEGEWSTETKYNNLGIGFHTAYIRDIYNCGVLSYDFYIVDYPRFFTPNGDGQNDYWQIIGIQDLENVAIQIFDRYGKILKVLYKNDLGWDGTISGQNLPADDYWFIINFITTNNEGQKVRMKHQGHFSLVR